MPKNTVRSDFFRLTQSNKKCTRCGDIKPPTEFYKNKKVKKDGLCGHCKECQHKADAAKAFNTKVIVRHKKCTKCYNTMPAAEFAKSSISRDGLNAWCKICVRKYHTTYDSKPENKRRDKGYRLKREYGITLSQYEAMVKNQRGVCAICKRPETLVDWRTGNTQNLAVDHNHNTKKVRDLLCHMCNKTLGAIEKYNLNPAWFGEYLKKHS